jgi:hypothetical protein
MPPIPIPPPGARAPLRRGAGAALRAPTAAAAAAALSLPFAAEEVAEEVVTGARCPSLDGEEEGGRGLRRTGVEEARVHAAAVAAPVPEGMDGEAAGGETCRPS